MPITLTQSRRFPTQVVLCVVSKYIPDSTLMPEIYRLLEFMTGGPVSTSQLSAAMHEANRFLTYRNPRLAYGWDSVARDPEAVRGWFAKQMTAEGDTLDILRI